MPQHDLVIIGGGHNGLACAFYLAKAGYKPLVLERRHQVGGSAITEEIYPGFRCPTLAHSAGPLRPEIVSDMQLERHGLKFIKSDVAVLSLSTESPPLVLYEDRQRAMQEIVTVSPKDAASFAESGDSLTKMSAVVTDFLRTIPPDVNHPSKGDLWSMLKTSRAVRALGKKDMYRLLRWGPAPIADVVSELFKNELLRATIAARGIFGTFLGPWSAGSTFVLLIRTEGDGNPVGCSHFAARGVGAITQAMASAVKKAGGEIRCDAEIEEIRIKDGRAIGVVLSNGEEVSASAVVSNADPKRTLLKLLDPIHLSPDFANKLQHYRMPGSVAKINLCLSGLPEFTAVKTIGKEVLSGRIHIGPSIDYLEHAFDNSKYGDFSRQPFLEVTIPSLSDPSMAPPGKHVMSIYMQYAPFKLKAASWESQRVPLADTVVKTLAEYAPNLPELILHHQIITPQDLEDTYGLTGGHIFHGELALDQFFTMRPLLGWSRYQTPIENLYLCGSGTHPGVGLTGQSGANAAKAILRDLRNKGRQN